LLRPIDILRLALPALLPAALAAQAQELDLHVGRWYGDNRAHTYEFRAGGPLTGGLTHGFTAAVLLNDSLGRRRAFYGGGYELQAFRGRAGVAPYALAGAALGLSTDTSTQALALLWSIGGGVEWRPMSRFAVGVEARYRIEDRGPRGFWRTSPDSRSGLGIAVGLSLGIGRREAGGGRATYAPPASPLPLSLSAPGTLSGNSGDVVETALDVLGTPYQWGGTADNGFDCSGLIQYAYAQHGIRLPRRSRDQAQVGAEVTPVVEALRPGDILLFSMRPGAGVTHVGLHVADGKFIHSATNGVKMSRLDPHDPEGAYWLARWVGVRRVIP